MKVPSLRVSTRKIRLIDSNSLHTNHQRIPLAHTYSNSSYSTTSTSPPQPTSDSSSLPSSRPPRIIFSGIQPTGIPHIGNYLGALQQWVHLQNTSLPGDKLFFSVVDLHAITVKQDPEVLRRQKREMFASLLAVGLEPGVKRLKQDEKEVTIFHQSAVKSHTDLMWILSTTASMGYLSRMTQWKSKLNLQDDASPLDEKARSKLKLGLFSYPVLQAADVLAYRATHVPVGEDQSQHLEFARECVTNFNAAYGPHLVSPETLISQAKRVMSLQSPLTKMSKSDPNPLSKILITDTPSEINRKIMAAVTDSTNSVSYDPVNRRAVSNLVELLSHFDKHGRSPEELGRLHEGVGLGEFKKLLAAGISEHLEPVRKKYEVFVNEDEGRYVNYMANMGMRRANEHSGQTMSVVKKAVGLWM